MCGIFGITVGEGSFLAKRLPDLLKGLFLFSESRGKEASGIAVSSRDKIHVLKSAVAASAMIRSHQYRQLLVETLHETAEGLQSPLAIIGHSRLVTDGSRYDQGNNQPVLAGDCVGIHNGIIVNSEEIWQEQSDLRRQYQVDSEVILALLRKFLREQRSIIRAAQKIFTTIQGAASIAVLFRDFDRLLLGTNNGSLYYTSIASLKTFIFASEKYILDRLLVKHVPKHAREACVKKIEPGRGCLIDIQSITAL